MDIKELYQKVKNGELKESHTSYFGGYVSRVSGQEITPYDGKFGNGYAVLSPNWGSTRYSFITYYVRGK